MDHHHPSQLFRHQIQPRYVTLTPYHHHHHHPSPTPAPIPTPPPQSPYPAFYPSPQPQPQPQTRPYDHLNPPFGFSSLNPIHRPVEQDSSRSSNHLPNSYRVPYPVSADDRHHPHSYLNRHGYQLESAYPENNPASVWDPSRILRQQCTVSPYQPTDRFRQVSAASSSDFRFGNTESNPPSYNQRRAMIYDDDKDMISRRDVHASSFSFEMGNSKGMIMNGDSDGVRAVSGKRDYYSSESERYNGRGSREGSYEFTRTPRKQTQKKSALLRIQVKPNHRNWEAEHPHHLNSNSFKGKVQIGVPDCEMQERVKERSPVELDVSFKSNSLVAKAIVAPSSSLAVPDPDLVPRNKKTRKSLAFEGNCLNSQPTKQAKCNVVVDSFPQMTSNASSNSDKGEGVLLKDACDISPHLNFDGATISKEKCEVQQISDKVTAHVSSKSSAHKVTKRKKVVKRVVRRPVNHNSHVSGLRSADTFHGPTTSCNKNVTPLKEETSAADKVLVTDSDFQSCSKEETVLTINDKAGDSSHALGALKFHTEGISGGLQSRVETDGNFTYNTSDFSTNKDNKIVNSSLNAHDTVHSLHTITNSDIDSLLKSSSSDFGGEQDVNRDNINLSVENDTKKSYSEGLYHGGDNSNCGLLGSAENRINPDLEDICYSFQDRAHSFNCDVLGNSEVKITTCNNGNSGIVDKKSSMDQFTKTAENGVLEGVSKIIPSQGNIIIGVKTSINNGPRYEECLNPENRIIQRSDNSFTNSNQCVPFSRSGNMYDTKKQLSHNGLKLSQKSSILERSLNDIASVGCTDRDTNEFENREVRTELEISSSNIEDISMELVNPVSYPYLLDKTLNLHEDGGHVEGVDPPVHGSFTSSQPSADGASVLHETNSLGEAETKSLVETDEIVGPFVVSPMQRKEEASACHPNFLSTDSEIDGRAIVASHSAEGPICLDGDLFLKQDKAVTSSIQTLPTSLMPCADGRTVSPEISLVGPTSMSVKEYKESFHTEGLSLQQSGIFSHLNNEDLSNSNVQSPCFLKLESKTKENAVPDVAIDSMPKNVMVLESAEKKTCVDGAEDQVDVHGETAQCKIVLELKSEFVHRSHSVDTESDDAKLKDHIPNESNYPSVPADGDRVSTCNSNDDFLDSKQDALLDMGSLGTILVAPRKQIMDCKGSLCANRNQKHGGDDKKHERKPMAEDGSDLPGCISLTQCTKICTMSDGAKCCDNKVKSDELSCNNMKLNNSNDHVNPGMVKEIPMMLVHGSSASDNQSLNNSCSRLNGRKNNMSRSFPLNSRVQPSLGFSTLKKPVSFPHVLKARTWHRNVEKSTLRAGKASSGSVPLKRQIQVKNRDIQGTSYIRKGNSLVRKPSPATPLPHNFSINHLDALGSEDTQKDKRSQSRVDVTDVQNPLITGGTNGPLERPRTPPLQTCTKLPNSSASSSGDPMSSMLTEPLSHGCFESMVCPVKIIESNDALNSVAGALKQSEIPESKSGVSIIMESHINEGTLTSDLKKIVYVKRKSNQLVATTNSSDLPGSNSDKIQPVTSDGYFKRRKNQLVRSTVESNINQTVNPDNLLNTERKRASKLDSSKRFSKRRSHKVAGRSTASFVWTLSGAKSSKNDSNPVHYEKVLPHLFPWKRSMHWRRFVQNPAASLNDRSLSAISKKLLLLRKRDTVYTRSVNGFSLRKSKVLSFGGSNLKWSKSIERNSKKANEEATLAVAAVEWKKRERKHVAVDSGTKSRRHSSGERIFRIGSIRYRMDSSRRTLQRISDDESPFCDSLQSDKNVKVSFVPRRLVIGNNEYVRIGNGNKLIRDPKKRTRLLASEKVRWSLHTARLRLARKQKYCQFFTRFGKCNKDDGKCPYIHDPSKIAVCTKFLNGLCIDPICRLTHKVIPERMPDCSFFLQGLCTNRNCPYRHVNVNPKASTCEGFLRGYCVNGNECQMKHSYLCPTFEATGVCPEGTKCKLHHPKTQRKRKKMKRSEEQKNARGRYFGSVLADFPEPNMVVVPKQSQQSMDGTCFEGADYISLDLSDDEVGCEIENQRWKGKPFCGIDPLDMQLVHVDELIKPVGIMK